MISVNLLIYTSDAFNCSCKKNNVFFLRILLASMDTSVLSIISTTLRTLVGMVGYFQMSTFYLSLVQHFILLTPKITPSFWLGFTVDSMAIDSFLNSLLSLLAANFRFWFDLKIIWIVKSSFFSKLSFFTFHS